MSGFDAAAVQEFAPQIWQTVRVPNPGAGAEWRAVVPGSEIWRLQSVFYVYTAFAAVASRRTALVLSDGDETYGQFAHATAITTGQAVPVSWQDGYPLETVQGANVRLVLPMTGQIMLGGWSISSVTEAMNAGDTYTAIALRIERVQAGLSLNDVARRAEFAAWRDGALDFGG